MQINN